jgi:hypothetical protein
MIERKLEENKTKEQSASCAAELRAHCFLKTIKSQEREREKRQNNIVYTVCQQHSPWRFIHPRLSDTTKQNHLLDAQHIAQRAQ